MIFFVRDLCPEVNFLFGLKWQCGCQFRKNFVSVSDRARHVAGKKKPRRPCGQRGFHEELSDDYFLRRARNIVKPTEPRLPKPSSDSVAGSGTTVIVYWA